MAKKSKFSISSPILYIILGALLVIFKSQMLSWAMTIAGVCCVIMGIIDLAKGRTKSGIFNAALGVIILVVGWTILNIVLLVLGVLIAAKGVIDLVEVLKHKNNSECASLFVLQNLSLYFNLSLFIEYLI